MGARRNPEGTGSAKRDTRGTWGAREMPGGTKEDSRCQEGPRRCLAGAPMAVGGAVPGLGMMPGWDQIRRQDLSMAPALPRMVAPGTS